MNWSQPTCSTCWRQRHQDRTPVRVADAQSETCCFCGNSTGDGIYVRVDPRTVKFPKGEDA